MSIKYAMFFKIFIWQTSEARLNNRMPALGMTHSFICHVEQAKRVETSRGSVTPCHVELVETSRGSVD